VGLRAAIDKHSAATVKARREKWGISPNRLTGAREWLGGVHDAGDAFGEGPAGEHTAAEDRFDRVAPHA